MFECGVDIVRIDRIAKSIQNPRFLERVFSAEEICVFAQKNMPVQSIAAAFSAKEAFSKALGTGVRGFSLPEVEVLHDALGKPYFRLGGRAAARAAERGLAFSLSLSHTDEVAVAFVVAHTVTADVQPEARID